MYITGTQVFLDRCYLPGKAPGNRPAPITSLSIPFHLGFLHAFICFHLPCSTLSSACMMGWYFHLIYGFSLPPERLHRLCGSSGHARRRMRGWPVFRLLDVLPGPALPPFLGYLL